MVPLQYKFRCGGCEHEQSLDFSETDCGGEVTNFELKHSTIFYRLTARSRVATAAIFQVCSAAQNVRQFLYITQELKTSYVPM